MSARQRSALVTGASSGVGRAIALRLAQEGFDVGLVGRDRRRLAEVAEQATGGGVTARAYCADFSDLASLAGLARDFEDRNGGLDLLVHCAGRIELGRVEAIAEEALERQLRVNLQAPFRLTRPLLPLLRDRRGLVVFINSTAALGAGAEAGPYAASKAALRALADSLRAEVNEDGIRVLSLFLGRTATPMQQAVCEHEGRDYRPERLIQPDDVASLVLAAARLPETTEVTEIRMRPAARPALG